MMMPPAPPRPRSSRTRRVVSWVTGYVFAATLIAPPLLPSLDLAWHHYEIGRLLTWLIAGGIVAWLAPMVSYRRRDWLFLLVPVWNVVVLHRIGSRLCRLDARDWPQRPDELTAKGPYQDLGPDFPDIGQSFQPPISNY